MASRQSKKPGARAGLLGLALLARAAAMTPKERRGAPVMRSRLKVRGAAGVEGGPTAKPFPPARQPKRRHPGFFALNQNWREKSEPDADRDQSAKPSGAIGVFKKTASSAATISAAATPPTHAAQPNMSNSVPSTALPIKPPKK